MVHSPGQSNPPNIISISRRLVESALAPRIVAASHDLVQHERQFVTAAVQREVWLSEWDQLELAGRLRQFLALPEELTDVVWDGHEGVVDLAAGLGVDVGVGAEGVAPPCPILAGRGAGQCGCVRGVISDGRVPCAPRWVCRLH